MKAMKLLSSVLIISLVLFFVQANAQKVGVAADKQKQENLEKIKKHQAELKKKFNSMTPEQKAEAQKKVNAYKRSGGKVTPAGSSSSTVKTVKSPGVPAVVNKTTEQQKQGNVKKNTGSGKPVWMDEKGKPKTSGKAVTSQVGKTESKPATPVKPKNTYVKKAGEKINTAVQTTKK